MTVFEPRVIGGCTCHLCSFEAFSKQATELGDKRIWTRPSPVHGCTPELAGMPALQN